MTIPFHTPLSAAQQRDAGITVPQPLAIADMVRYAELDPLNHVNNKSYMGWFETLRVAYSRQFCQKHFNDQAPPRMVLRSAEMRFVKEMTLGEVYIATARVTAFRSSSYTISQEIWSKDLRATMSAVMVMLQPDGAGRMPLPQALCAHFVAADGATPPGPRATG